MSSPDSEVGVAEAARRRPRRPLWPQHAGGSPPERRSRSGISPRHRGRGPTASIEPASLGQFDVGVAVARRSTFARARARPHDRLVCGEHLDCCDVEDLDLSLGADPVGELERAVAGARADLEQALAGSRAAAPDAGGRGRWSGAALRPRSARPANRPRNGSTSWSPHPVARRGPVPRPRGDTPMMLGSGKRRSRGARSCRWSPRCPRGSALRAAPALWRRVPWKMV